MFAFIVADPNINSSTSSEQNEGFANPTGNKVKKKTVRGSSRPANMGVYFLMLSNLNFI